MHITATTVVITIAVCIIGLACWAFEALCVHLDHHDQAEAEQVYAARHDHTRPRMEPADPFSWIHTQAIVDEHRERLPASTGELRRLSSTAELRALYQRPYPDGFGRSRTPDNRTTDTTELRALAEAGDLAGIDGILSRWASENLTEGEAA
jgi:hypothetical protein